MKNHLKTHEKRDQSGSKQNSKPSLNESSLADKSKPSDSAEEVTVIITENKELDTQGEMINDTSTTELTSMGQINDGKDDSSEIQVSSNLEAEIATADDTN